MYIMYTYLYSLKDQGDQTLNIHQLFSSLTCFFTLVQLSEFFSLCNYPNCFFEGQLLYKVEILLQFSLSLGCVVWTIEKGETHTSMARMNYIYRQRNCGQTLSVPPSKPQQLNHQRWKKHSLYPKHICNDTRQRRSNMVHIQTIYLKHFRNVWIYWEAWDDTCHMYDCSCLLFRCTFQHMSQLIVSPPPPPASLPYRGSIRQTMLLAQYIYWPFDFHYHYGFYHCVFLSFSAFVVFIHASSKRVCFFNLLVWLLSHLNPSVLLLRACWCACLLVHLHTYFA